MRAIPLHYGYLRNGFEFVWPCSHRASAFTAVFRFPRPVVRPWRRFTSQASRNRPQSRQAQEGA